MSASADSDERTPIALCLEKLGASPDERYTRCTARSGRLAGLAIGIDGAILWCVPRPVACELWVSRDQRLMALRPEGAAPVAIVRAGREVAIPEEKPVVLRHLDELLFDGVRYRVHVHGTTTEVHPPRRILTLPRVITLAAAMATGIACSPAADPAPQGAGDAGDETREPALIGDRPDAAGWSDAEPSLIIVDAADSGTESDVIDIRPQPPN